MPLLLYHFRCHVLFRSTNRLRQLSLLEIASHTKVNEADVAIIAKHNVLQLQVPVHDITFMKVTKCTYYLDCIKLCLNLWNVIFLAKELKQVATSYKIHNEVNLEIVLEDIPGANHELVMCLRQDTLLEEARFDHVCVDDVLLFNRLHSKHLFSLFLLYQENLAKTALTYKSFDFEIFEIGYFVRVGCVFHFSFRIIVFKIIPRLVNNFQFFR